MNMIIVFSGLCALVKTKQAVASPLPSSAVVWGNEDFGGDASSVDLSGVIDAMCGQSACVARKNDGTAVA